MSILTKKSVYFFVCSRIPNPSEPNNKILFPSHLISLKFFSQLANCEKNFNEIKWDGNNILLFGSEGFGMREHTKKYTDFFVKIDINKNIESLNISNSAAIVFHHINQYKNKT